MRGKRSQQGHRAEGGESRAAGWPAILAEWREYRRVIGRDIKFLFAVMKMFWNKSVVKVR